MPIAVAVWSFTLQPGEPQEFVPPSDVVITNIALGDKIEDEKSRTTIKLTYLSPVNVNDSEDEDENDDEGSGGTVEETVLCSLTPGKIEQATTNITLEGEEEYLLQAIGKNTIYLTGNYIDQSPDNVPYNDDSEPEDEDDFDLREVSSDVELDPMDMVGIEEDDDDEEEEDSHRFEEVPDETEPPSKKRARESNASPSDEKLSKAQDKKAKKQKTVNGEAVPTASSTEPGQESEKKDKKDKKKKKEKKGEEKSDGKTSSTKELAGGLKITDVKVGDGPQAKPGQKLSMRYIGKLQNGKIFDQNTKGKPFEFNLGRGEVIKGWDEGLKGMHVGGERLLVIPPGMAYGKQKQQGIPANSTLTFEVKLIGSK